MLNGEDMLARCREGDAVQLKDNLEKLTQCMFETRHKVERKKVWKCWWLVDFTPSSQADVCVTHMNGTYSTLALSYQNIVLTVNTAYSTETTFCFRLLEDLVISCEQNTH